MNLSELNVKFVWSKDGKIDSWKLLEGDYPLRGDCDDYSLTALYIICDHSWIKLWWRLITLQSVFWYTKTKSGESHLMLWDRNRGWIDNTNPSFGERKLKKIFPAPFPLVMFKIFLGKFVK